MTPLRSTFQRELSNNIEYGEAILTMLRRKAECQLERITPGHDEQVVEFWRSGRSESLGHRLPNRIRRIPSANASSATEADDTQVDLLRRSG